MTKAAQALGLERSHLYRKMRSLGIAPTRVWHRLSLRAAGGQQQQRRPGCSAQFWFRAATRFRLWADANVSERIKEPENIQEPEHYGYHYYRVQDWLDCSLHGDEVDQPQQNSYDDQNHYYRQQWHLLLTSFVEQSYRLFSMWEYSAPRCRAIHGRE
jgi:hypothetical protein